MEKAIIKSDTPFRPGNAEHLSTQRTNKVPKCILELPSANGARVPLNEEEVSSGVCCHTCSVICFFAAGT
jgi:hypothetical protein